MKKQKGFTLIEMIIYMSLLSVLILVLSAIFTSMFDVQSESETTARVQQDGRFILSRLSYDLPRAQNIITPALLEEESASLQITIDGINYTYSLNNQNLLLTNNLGTNQLNSNETSVSNLTFKRLGAAGGKNNIRTSLTLTSKTKRPGGPEIKTFQTTGGLR